MSNCGMNKCLAAKKAGEYFGDQFHCAEAVTRAALESIGKAPDELVACSTAFGGGFGKSFQETCGALSGATLVIGHLYGRREPGESWEYPASLAAMVRDAFVEEHGTTKCISLREKFGPEAQMSECRKIVSSVTKELLDVIEQK